VGDVVLDLTYRKNEDGITLAVQRSGSGACTISFAPALSPRAQLLSVNLNRRSVTSHLESHQVDQHPYIQFPVEGASNTLQIRTRNDFGLSLEAELPQLGSTSLGLRSISESWSAERNTLTMDVEGMAGTVYQLGIWNATQISSAEGAVITSEEGKPKLKISFPPGDSASYVHQQVKLHFVGRGRNRRTLSSPPPTSS
jgi:hypothetical protein